MPTYILRAVRRIEVFEAAGIEKTVECDSVEEMRVEAAKFASEVFVVDPGLLVETTGPDGKRVNDPQRKDTQYGSPF